jgi:hypothetical protein
MFVFFVLAVAAQPLPAPLAFWDLQEPTGHARISRGSAGPYALLDGNTSAPIKTTAVPGGAPFGNFAAEFSPRSSNNSARLYAPRAAVPRITDGIGGPAAQVTVVAWVSVPAGGVEGMVAGVWDEYGVHGGTTGARQYAIFLNLGKCAPANGSQYNGGLAGHISPVGGPTPGQRFCVTAACDPRRLAPAVWHCLATTYDDANIVVYVNGTFQENKMRNPFPLAGGIWSPSNEPGRVGAEFGVGANRINETVGGPFLWANRYVGLIGGIAVWDVALSAGDVARACALGRGF